MKRKEKFQFSLLQLFLSSRIFFFKRKYTHHLRRHFQLNLQFFIPITVIIGVEDVFPYTKQSFITSFK